MIVGARSLRKGAEEWDDSLSLGGSDMIAGEDDYDGLGYSRRGRVIVDREKGRCGRPMVGRNDSGIDLRNSEKKITRMR